jgi:hypothetical protein
MIARCSNSAVSSGVVHSLSRQDDADRLLRHLFLGFVRWVRHEQLPHRPGGQLRVVARHSLLHVGGGRTSWGSSRTTPPSSASPRCFDRAERWVTRRQAVPQPGIHRPDLHRRPALRAGRRRPASSCRERWPPSQTGRRRSPPPEYRSDRRSRSTLHHATWLGSLRQQDECWTINVEEAPDSCVDRHTRHPVCF